MLEIATLTVGNRRLPFRSCSLRASAEEAYRQASFDLAWGEAELPCEPDDEATVDIGGQRWLTGYVRDLAPEDDGESSSLGVTVVSRAVDAREASIDHPTGSLQDCDLKQVAEEFDTGGVGIECDAATLRKRVHNVRPGESLFETLETDARAQGVLIYDTPKGKLKITDKPEGRHAGALVRGRNIKRSSARLSGRNNFSTVKVRGQASEGTTGTALRPEAEAPAGATRHRPLIRVHEGEATSDRMKRRASWEARRAAGAAKSCTVVVAGWRDEAGRIWAPNFLVEVRNRKIGIEGDMIVASVSLDQDGAGEGGGTTATLELKDPRALGGENPRGKSKKAWSAPAVPVPTFREG